MPNAKDPTAAMRKRATTGWVTARFTAEKPLPKTVWEKWLREAHALRA